MKRIRFVAASLAVLSLSLFGAASAQAHTLSKGDAALYIRIEASDYFEWKYESSDNLVTYPKLYKYDCSKVSSHVVECDGTFEILDFSDYSGYDEECEFTARARYQSFRSYEPRVRITDHSCY